MQMDPKTFEGIRISSLFECCPKCSRVSRFSKSDYLFRSDHRDPSRWRGRGRRTAV